METTTYFLEEAKSMIYDGDTLSEWEKKISELGLTGQKKLQSEEGKSPIPFVFMNQTMRKCLYALCPASASVAEYDKTPIPIEVLSLIALARQEGYFETLEIYYDDQSPDPILVGKKQTGTWSHDHYLLARWGDHEKPLPELIELGRQRLVKEATRALEEKLHSLSKIVKDVAGYVEKNLAGEWTEFWNPNRS